MTTDTNSNDDLSKIEPAAEAASADTLGYDLGPLADTSSGVSQGAVAALDAVYEAQDAVEHAGAVIEFCADYEPSDALWADLQAHKAAIALYLAIANRIDAGGNVMPILQAALDAIHAQDEVEAALNEDILSRPLEVVAAGPAQQ